MTWYRYIQFDELFFGFDISFVLIFQVYLESRTIHLLFYTAAHLTFNEGTKSIYQLRLVVLCDDIAFDRLWNLQIVIYFLLFKSDLIKHISLIEKSYLNLTKTDEAWIPWM